MNSAFIQILSDLARQYQTTPDGVEKDRLKKIIDKAADIIYGTITIEKLRMATLTKTSANMGFAKMGADGSRVSTFCFSIWLHIQQDVINLAMCKSSAFIYKFSFS